MFWLPRQNSTTTELYIEQTAETTIDNKIETLAIKRKKVNWCAATEDRTICAY